MIMQKKNRPRYDITFICRKGKDHFAEPIVKELGKKYSIQYLYPEHKREYSHRQVLGDIIWVEWALKFARLVSRKKWGDKKVFVRLHRWEINTEFMSTVKWENIDSVIFVNNHFEDEFRQNVTGDVATLTIPNALSVHDFPFHPAGDSKRFLSYSLAFNPVKRYVELVHFFSKLISKDDSFRLSILAGKAKTQKENDYLERIKGCISELEMGDFVSIIEREYIGPVTEDRKNIHRYLTGHDAVISFSQLESFHYAFAEGLLSGLQGFYNSWENPLIKEYWGKWGYNSEEEMIEGILAWSNLSPKEREKIAQANREYVITHFGSETISRAYEREFFK